MPLLLTTFEDRNMSCCGMVLTRNKPMPLNIVADVVDAVRLPGDREPPNVEAELDSALVKSNMGQLSTLDFLLACFFSSGFFHVLFKEKKHPLATDSDCFIQTGPKPHQRPPVEPRGGGCDCQWTLGQDFGKSETKS